jgi:hypothetical protein
MGFWGADRVAIEIKNAYFDVGVPYFGIPVPMTVRFGLQPFAIRDTWFLSTDGTGILASLKADPVTIIPFWGKIREGKDASSDDADVYGIHAYAKVDAYTIGGYGAYYNMNSYPLNATTLIYGNNPGNRAQATWLGAYFDGTFGPVRFNTDFIYDFGEIEAGWDNAAGLPVGADDTVDLSGWLAQGSFVWPCDLFEFGGGLMYASGADGNKTSQSMLPGTTTGNGTFSDKMKGFVVPPGSEPGADGMGFGSVIYGHPYLSREPAWGNQTADNNNMTSGSHVGGSWNARLWGSYKVAPWYKVTLQAMYVGDTVKNGNWLANKIDPVTGEFEDEDSIGFEVTLTNMFQIYKNLSAGLVFGYLWGGDAITDWQNDDIDNPWMIGTRMVYSF